VTSKAACRADGGYRTFGVALRAADGAAAEDVKQGLVRAYRAEAVPSRADREMRSAVVGTHHLARNDRRTTDTLDSREHPAR
jgi:hypothetical protein